MHRPMRKRIHVGLIGETETRLKTRLKFGLLHFHFLFLSLYQTNSTSTHYSPNSILPTSPKLKVGVMECELKGTSRVCRGLVADVTVKSA